MELAAERVLAFRMERQALTRRAGRAELVDVVRRLVGVQSQMPAAAALSLRARIAGLADGELEEALYRRKVLARAWSLRGTAHLLAKQDHASLVAALGTDVGGLRRALRRRGLTDRAYERIREAVLDALGATAMTREELGAALARLGGLDLFGSWGGVLRLLSQGGDVLFGPPRGTRTTFVRTDRWWPRRPRAAARPVAELARRYLGAYGPASAADFAYWTGLGVGAARAAFAALAPDLVDVTVGGRPLHLLGRDLAALERAPAPAPARLLPHFDVYVLAHRDKRLFLDAEHHRAVHREAGWISPVILARGRVVGTWRYDRTARGLRVSLEPFRPLPRPLRAALESDLEALER